MPAPKDYGYYYYTKRGYFGERSCNVDRKLTDIILESKPEVVLNIGCGFGTLNYFLSERGICSVGIDINPTAVQMSGSKGYSAQNHSEFILGDATRMPFDDDSFDYLIAKNFIEHLTSEEAERFLLEAGRVLTGEGSVLICSPVKTHFTNFLKYFFLAACQIDSDCVDHTGDRTHKKWYGLPELKDMVEGIGFQVYREGYFLFRDSGFPRESVLSRSIEKLDRSNHLSRHLGCSGYMIARKAKI